MEMGSMLKNCRLRAGISPAQLAESLGVPLQTIDDWEQGRSLPGSNQLLGRLMMALGLSPGDRVNLVDRENEMARITTMMVSGFSSRIYVDRAEPGGEVFWDNASYYSCVISYSSKDKAFVERLRTDLVLVGVVCWYAPEDLSIGERIRAGIHKAIDQHDKLLLILSRDAVESNWVESEVEKAMDRERNQPGLTVLFPIRLDDAVLESRAGWAGDIRLTRHIGDFRQWQDPTAYGQSLERLLRDLRK